MFVKTSCNKCGAVVHLDLGEMNREEAERAFENLNRNGRECPGGHVELGGLYRMWNLEEVLHRAYDLGESDRAPEPPTDEEYVRALKAEGKEIIDGGSNTLPLLNLPSIHDLAGLRHLGGGNFGNDDFLFLRCDSPVGTRFYERAPRTPKEPPMVPDPEVVAMKA